MTVRFRLVSPTIALFPDEPHGVARTLPFGAVIDVDDVSGNRLIEVKTTNGWERTPFHITRNELAVAEASRADWQLVRLWNFSREPRAFELRPPLDAHVALMATSYQASFH